MLKFRNFLKKAKRHLWGFLVRYFRSKKYYPIIYRSWWHSRFYRTVKLPMHRRYLAAVPNPGAGIGHQMANWIAGLWYARYFGLLFAHIPFSCEKWEQLLGFGVEEINADDLVKNKGYRRVWLPLFDEFNNVEVEIVRNVIDSYGDQKVLFVLEQDQAYKDQFGVIETIQQKFYKSKDRKNDCLQFEEENYNIAIHVRRGDIVAGQVNGNPNLLMRWLDSNYFENVLDCVLANLKQDKPIKIYLFSQGEKEEFLAFDKYENIQFFLKMGPHDSFLHMVFADLLITSKSSFSYKPALLSKGVKVCPQYFWHGYPDLPDWIVAEVDGTLNEQAINKLNSIPFDSKGNKPMQLNINRVYSFENILGEKK